MLMRWEEIVCLYKTQIDRKYLRVWAVSVYIDRVGVHKPDLQPVNFCFNTSLITDEKAKDLYNVTR